MQKDYYPNKYVYPKRKRLHKGLVCLKSSIVISSDGVEFWYFYLRLLLHGLFLHKTSVMIGEEILAFYRALAENNYREWFHANKEWYEKIKKLQVELVSSLIKELQKVDPLLGALTPSDCIFRINRDIRFSNNKDPYKSHAGLFFTRGGKKSPFGGYYLHLEPGKSFIGGGVYGPSPENLKALRQEIFYNWGDFEKIVNNKKFMKFYPELMDMGDSLSRPPKGYSPDFEGIEVLKKKHFVTGLSLSDAEIASADLVALAIEPFTAMVPFIHFLNQAIEG